MSSSNFCSPHSKTMVCDSGFTNLDMTRVERVELNELPTQGEPLQSNPHETCGTDSEPHKLMFINVGQEEQNVVSSATSPPTIPVNRIEDGLENCVLSGAIMLESVEGVSDRVLTKSFNQELCRLCALNASDFIPLFTGQGLELQLVEKIHSCLPIKVLPGDKLPTHVCTTCSAKLDVCHDLVSISIAADSKLRAMHSDLAKRKLISGSEELVPELSSLSKDVVCRDLKGGALLGLDVMREQKDGIPIIIGKKSSPRKNIYIPDVVIEDCLEDMTASNVSPPSSLALADKKWACELCDYKASRRTSLVLHKQQKHSRISDSPNKNSSATLSNSVPKDSKSSQLLFSCEYCDKTFQSSSRWQKHCQYHTKLAMRQRRELCSECHEEFFTSKELRNHLKSAHGIEKVRKFSCDQCDKSYSIPSSLDIHRATHSKETPYLCDLCGKSFKHASNLRCHKRSHAEDSVRLRHACDVCPKTFISKFHLREHQNVHKDIKPYACPECGKTFHRRLQLRQHRFTHTTQNAYECPQCGVRFNRRGNMTQHMKRHLRDKKFLCKVCKASFLSLSEVIKHRREHSTQDVSIDFDESESFACPHCQKKFNKHEEYDAHIKSHGGEKAFQCSLCEKRLSNRRTLDYHMRSFHTGERPYPCQFCSESFLSREARTVHERLHTGEKPFVCNICNMSFRCSSNLSQHTRTHTDDRPWACDHCPKRFKRKGILGVHLRTHTGERPYCCDICGRRFTQKNDMLKHQQTHSSSAQTYTCTNCQWTFHSRKELTKHQQSHYSVTESVSSTTCLPSHSQAVVIATDNITNFPITIMENGNNIIVHRIEDVGDHTQVLTSQPQILHLAEPMLQTTTDPQLLLSAPENSHIIQYVDGTVVLQSTEDHIMS